jgi:hypothetical protein
VNILNARELRERYKMLFQQYLSDMHVSLDNAHWDLGYNDSLKLRLHIEDSREYRVITENEAGEALKAVDEALEGFDKEHISTVVAAVEALGGIIGGFRSDLVGSIEASVREPQGTNRSMTFSIPRYRRRFLGIYERFHKKLMEEDIQKWKRAHTNTYAGVIYAECGAMVARSKTHMDYDIITMTEFNTVYLGCSRLTDGIRLVMKGGVNVRQRGYIEASNGIKILNEFLGAFRTTFAGAMVSKVKDAIAAPPELPVSTQISLREMPPEYVKRVVYAWTTRREINYGAATMKPGDDGVYIYDFNSTIASGFIPEKHIAPYMKRFKNLSDEELLASE